MNLQCVFYTEISNRLERSAKKKREDEKRVFFNSIRKEEFQNENGVERRRKRKKERGNCYRVENASKSFCVSIRTLQGICVVICTLHVMNIIERIKGMNLQNMRVFFLLLRCFYSPPRKYTHTSLE